MTRAPQKREVHLAVALSLRLSQAGELRVSVNLDALEQVAAEEIAASERRTRSSPDPLPGLDHALNLDGIDEAIRKIERDGFVAGRLHASAVRVVQQRSELAQTPSKLAARIVGDVHSRAHNLNRE